MSKRATRSGTGSNPVSDGSDDENDSFLSYNASSTSVSQEQSRSGSPANRYPLHSIRHHHHTQQSSQTTLSDSVPFASSVASTPANHTTMTNTGQDEITLATAAMDPISIPVASGAATAAKGTTGGSIAGTATPTTATTAATYSKWSTIGHQLSFLGTGIFSTLAVQWLYYQGGASGTSMLTVFFNYIGMMCVGLVYAVQTWLADRHQRRLATTGTAEYNVLMTETNDVTEHDTYRNHVELLTGKTSSGLRKQLDHNSNSGCHVLEDEEEDDENIEDMFIREQKALEDLVDEEKQRLRFHKNKLAFSSLETEGKKSFTSRFGLHWPVIQVAVMDVVANALVTVGFFYVGSGMYQVIYSSIVIWCAILTRIFLSRKLNNIQWVAIVGVTFGLAVSALGTVQDASPDGPTQTFLEKSFGALITLGATFLYACVYVLSDKVLATFKPTPVPEKVCSMVGGYASVLTFIYLCVHTFPQWQTEVVDVVEYHGNNWIGIILVYPLLTISSMLHSLNYYVLLSRINNIAVGILQSLRAVLVFVMSHYLFCGISSTQCFNQWKFVSAIVVIGCVTLFSFNSAPKIAASPTLNPTNDTANNGGGGASHSTGATFSQAPKTGARSTALHRTHSPIPRRSASSESP
ncbi:hypothetical protein BGZ83_005836 [Gryganskiella cystojenkinii]|nr:hypothetical protein BGZ83_005836 [Gryganskiella cystojenkinii]